MFSYTTKYGKYETLNKKANPRGTVDQRVQGKPNAVGKSEGKG